MDTNLRREIIKKVIADANFKKICFKINSRYGEDIFQEVCEEILSIPEARLPEMNYLNFWFYRVAVNTMSVRGKLGKVVLKDSDLENRKVKVISNTNIEFENEKLIKKAEKFMLELSEFENRVILLYNELGNMKRVQKMTGISYSALRSVKEKIKQIR